MQPKLVLKLVKGTTHRPSVWKRTFMSSCVEDLSAKLWAQLTCTGTARLNMETEGHFSNDPTPNGASSTNQPPKDCSKGIFLKQLLCIETAGLPTSTQVGCWGRRFWRQTKNFGKSSLTQGNFHVTIQSSSPYQHLQAIHQLGASKVFPCRSLQRWLEQLALVELSQFPNLR